MCEHVADPWPRYRVAAVQQPRWKRFFTGVTYVTALWVCRKCGTEMVPVFKVKE